MNTPCEVIMDLLPLYHEDVCSQSSKKLVDAHICACGQCKSMLEAMKNNKFEERMAMERENVVDNHIKSVKKYFFVQGAGIAMAISIIPTFVINLATAGTLDWFFIVLSGAILFGALTLVPLLFEKNKGVWTLVSATASLLLLLFVIESYVSGPYATRWFGTAALSVLGTALVCGFIVKLLRK